MIEAISLPPWPEYELIDTGEFEKLERFGHVVVRRPEPQAIWNRSLDETTWLQQAQATFKREKGSSEKGIWELKKGTPDKWWIDFKGKERAFRFKLSLSGFKHVGIFPEQASNWLFIEERLKQVPQPSFLNLFAYTGAASIVAKAAGAEVTHVEAIKHTISWARENMEGNQLDNIRWMADDALKFTKREAKRGRKYTGILLDPPAYGRGPDGEKWILEENLNELLQACSTILDAERGFVIINLYSLSMSALVVENLLKAHFAYLKHQTIGEFYIEDSFGKKLPLGIFGKGF